MLKSAGKAQQREILPRWNYSLDLASDVHVQTFYFGIIALILLCINQSLKTETEGYVNENKRVVNLVLFTFKRLQLISDSHSYDQM